MLKMLTWEGEHKDFPHGPMYWITKREEKDKMEAIAVGSVNEKEREEKICVLTKVMLDNNEDTRIMNGHAETRPLIDTGNGLLTVPTQPASLAGTSTETNPNVTVSAPVVQEGGDGLASQPLTRFVTAHEGLENLSMDEKTGILPNGIGAIGVATVDAQTDGATYPIGRDGNSIQQESGASTAEQKSKELDQEKTGELKAKIEEALEKINEAVHA